MLCWVDNKKEYFLLWRKEESISFVKLQEDTKQEEAHMVWREDNYINKR
jgi:hypothetical protein